MDSSDDLIAGNIAIINSQKSPSTHVELSVLVSDKIRPSSVSNFSYNCRLVPLFGGVMLHPHFIPHREIGVASCAFVPIFIPIFMKEVTC